MTTLTVPGACTSDVGRCQGLNLVLHAQCECTSKTPGCEFSAAHPGGPGLGTRGNHSASVHFLPGPDAPVGSDKGCLPRLPIGQKTKVEQEPTPLLQGFVESQECLLGARELVQ